MSDETGKGETARIEAHPTDKYLVSTDWENNAEEWWDAADESGTAPPEMRPLLDGSTDDDRVTVSAEAYDRIRRWAESLPGWATGPEYAETPLLFRPLCAYCLHPSGGTASTETYSYGVYWDPVSRLPVAVCEDHEPTGEYGSPTEYVTPEEYAICEGAAEVADLPNCTRPVLPPSPEVEE